MNYKKAKNIFKEYRITIFSFILCFSVIFIIGFMQRPKWNQYLCDSGYYYQLSTTFLKDGSFSFTNFEQSFRGYLFPFVIYIYTQIGNLIGISSETSILIGSSFLVTFLFIVILPNLFSNTKITNILRLLLPVVFFMIYWSDLVYFPLSDLYSYGFLLIAIWVIKNINLNNRLLSIFYGAISGGLLYAAYNTRTIYIFVIPILLLIFIVIHKKENILMLSIVFATICLGAFICSLPQISINMYHYKKMTMTVITNSLNEFQLYVGLYLQRYETYAGDITTNPQSMGFIDGVGNQLIDKYNLVLNGNFTISKYLSIALQNPLDFMGIMARHFLNVFHLPFTHVYIKEINHKAFYTILNYSIIYIAGIGFITNIKNKENTIKFDNNMLYLLVTLIPCIAILPGAIEMRFFVPLYVIIYCFIAYKISFKQTVLFIWKHKISILISYIFILSVLSAVWGSTFNSSQIFPQLLG